MKRKMVIKTALLISTMTIGLFLGNDSYAEEVQSANGIKAELNYYNSLIQNKKNVLISLQDSSKNEITKNELLGLYVDNDITDVKNKERNKFNQYR